MVKWEKIQEHQRVREAIIEALEPLRELKHLVSAETASSITTLSGRIKTFLGKIRLQERFTYQDASLSRKAVNVEGSFDPGVQIDALLVANTSWLRAILWAFVFALREETIEQAGSNPMPLVLLDDPQVTFDPRNKRKWAQEIARLANADATDPAGMHLIVITHERQFFQFLVDEHQLKGQQGLVAPVNKASPVVTIVNGTNVDRLPAHDHEDVCQDLLVDLIARMKWFDPARATLGAFAGVVVRNRADQLAKHLLRERQLFGGWDPEATQLLASDCSSQTEQRLDLSRVILALSARERQLCAELVTHTPTEVVRLGTFSRASLYRRLENIRNHLRVGGLA